MQSKSEIPVLLLALGITIAVLAGGLWFLDRQDLLPAQLSWSEPADDSALAELERASPAIALAAADNRLVAGYYDGTLLQWDLATDALAQSFGNASGRVNSLAIASGRLVSGSGDGSTRIWDLQTASEVQEPLVVGARVLSVAAAGNGAAAAGYSDGSIRVWDMLSGQVQQELDAHTNAVTGLAFAPNNPQILASASHDQTVKIWDLSANPASTPQHVLDVGSKVNSVAIDPNGGELASGDYEGALRFWDLATGEELGRSLLGHSFIVGEVEFSPNADDQRLASVGYDEKVKLWDLNTGQELRTFDFSPEKSGFLFVTEFIATDAGLQLAVGGYDGIIRLLNLDSGQVTFLTQQTQSQQQFHTLALLNER